MPAQMPQGRHTLRTSSSAATLLWRETCACTAPGDQIASSRASQMALATPALTPESTSSLCKLIYSMEIFQLDFKSNPTENCFRFLCPHWNIRVEELKTFHLKNLKLAWNTEALSLLRTCFCRTIFPPSDRMAELAKLGSISVTHHWMPHIKPSAAIKLETLWPAWNSTIADFCGLGSANEQRLQFLPGVGVCQHRGARALQTQQNGYVRWDVKALVSSVQALFQSPLPISCRYDGQTLRILDLELEKKLPYALKYIIGIRWCPQIVVLYLIFKKYHFPDAKPALANCWLWNLPALQTVL